MNTEPNSQDRKNFSKKLSVIWIGLVCTLSLVLLYILRSPNEAPPKNFSQLTQVTSSPSIINSLLDTSHQQATNKVPAINPGFPKQKVIISTHDSNLLAIIPKSNIGTKHTLDTSQQKTIKFKEKSHENLKQKNTPQPAVTPISSKKHIVILVPKPVVQMTLTPKLPLPLKKILLSVPIHSLVKRIAVIRIPPKVLEFDASSTKLHRGQTISICVALDAYTRGNLTGIGPIPPNLTKCYLQTPIKTKTYTLGVYRDGIVHSQHITIIVKPSLMKTRSTPTVQPTFVDVP